MFRTDGSADDVFCFSSKNVKAINSRLTKLLIRFRIDILTSLRRIKCLDFNLFIRTHSFAFVFALLTFVDPVLEMTRITTALFLDSKTQYLKWPLSKRAVSKRCGTLEVFSEVSLRKGRMSLGGRRRPSLLALRLRSEAAMRG